MPPELPHHLARYRALLPDYDRFVEVMARPLAQTVATNTTRLTPGHLLELCGDHLSLTPVDWFPGAFRLDPEDRPGRHWSYTSGLYSVQEEASLVPVRMLDARPGERVLDLCAAPGSKTAQIAMAMGNRGTLIANDIKVARLSAVHDQCRRLGLLNLATTGHDGSVYPVEAGQFDRILVDAPCTAEGKARRGYMRDSKPAFRKWVQGQQRALLRQALELCRPGGRIVYATCTFAPGENEAIISDLLAEADGRLRARAPEFEVPGAEPGLEAFEGHRWHPDVRHGRRLWPHRTDTGGFFAIVLERTDSPELPPPALQPLPAAAPMETVLGYLERFDLPAGRLDDLHFFLDQKHLRAVRADHAPPTGIRLENLGVDFARRRSSHPKITTGSAMAIGAGARRNVVDLTPGELQQWRDRLELPLAASRLEHCERGYQLVRCRDLIHGTGFLRLDEDGSGRLESQFPKAWMRFRPPPEADPEVVADPGVDA